MEQHMSPKEFSKALSRARLMRVANSPDGFYWPEPAKRILLLGDSKAIEEVEKGFEDFPDGLPTQLI